MFNTPTTHEDIEAIKAYLRAFKAHLKKRGYSIKVVTWGFGKKKKSEIKVIPTPCG